MSDTYDYNDTRDGGPVFPTPFQAINTFGDVVTEYIDGMTLREYYAGLAMQAIISGRDGDWSIEDRCYDIAYLAAVQADALIAELERDQGGYKTDDDSENIPAGGHR